MGRCVVGKVSKCFGVKGYVKILPLTAQPERLQRLRSVFVGESESKGVKLQVEDVLVRSGSVIMKFTSVSDRTTAQQLRNKFLFVDERSVIHLSSNQYFIHDVIGCEVLDENQVILGKVVDIFNNTSQDVWLIQHGGKQYLLPAVNEFIRSVDIKNKKVTVHTINGLFD